MLIYYKGWGYVECDIEHKINPVSSEKITITPFKDTDNIQKVSGLFELPKEAEREIKFLDETTTNYLLFSSDKETKYQIPEWLGEYKIVGEFRFVLCEEPNYEASHENEHPKIKNITITKKALIQDISIRDTPKEVPEKEKNIMLKLIIGMAIDKYGYNPDSLRNKATGENSGSIKAALDFHGIKIDADTIRKYLNDAKELL
jgi:hypothetical protein